MRKNLTVLLVFVMALSLILTSCQSKSNLNGESGLNSISAPKERVKLKILFPAGANQIPSDADTQNNRWADVYKKAFPEVDFELIVSNNAGFGERKALMLASADVPDMMPASQIEIINYVEQGIVMPLDDIVKKYYPNILKFITADDMKIGEYNGKQYGMPVPNNSLQNPERMYIRKDWLEKLNLKVPSTIDEFYNTLAAFTAKDPDGNGMNDTFGIGGQKNLGMFAGVFAPFDVQPGWWSRINGKLTADYIRPEMKEALGFIRKIYAEGVMDKGAVNQTLAQAEQKANQNKYGVFSIFSWGMNTRLNQFINKTYGGEYMSLPPIKGPKGAQWTVRDRNYWGGNIYVVSAACKNPEYPAKILNWLLEEDKSKNYYALNADLINTGDIGLHGELAGKFNSPIAQANLSEEARKDLYRQNYRLMYGSTNMLKDSDMILHAEESVKSGSVYKYYAEDRKIVLQYGHYNDAIKTGPVTAELQSQMNEYFDEIKMKIVTGAIPLEAFDQWVDYYNKNGGQKIDEEINKLNPGK